MKKLIFIIFSLMLCIGTASAEDDTLFFSPDLQDMDAVELNNNLFELGLEAVITDICPSAVLFVGNNDSYIAGYLSPQTRFDYCSRLEPGTLPAIKLVPKDFALSIAGILDDTSSVSSLMDCEESVIMMITMFTPYEGIVFEPPEYVAAKRSLEQEAVRHGLKATEFWSILEESGVSQKNAVYTVLNGTAGEREIVEDVLRIRMENELSVKQNRIESLTSVLSDYIRIFAIVFFGIIIIISVFTFVSYRADRKSFMMEKDEDEEDTPGTEEKTDSNAAKEDSHDL